MSCTSRSKRARFSGPRRGNEVRHVERVRSVGAARLLAGLRRARVRGPSEVISTKITTIAPRTTRRGWGPGRCGRPPCRAAKARCAAYQRLTSVSITTPVRAASEKKATLRWPKRLLIILRAYWKHEHPCAPWLFSGPTGSHLAAEVARTGASAGTSRAVLVGSALDSIHLSGGARRSPYLGCQQVKLPG
jgi:hypothetical protein